MPRQLTAHEYHKGTRSKLKRNNVSTQLFETSFEVSRKTITC